MKAIAEKPAGRGMAQIYGEWSEAIDALDQWGEKSRGPVPEVLFRRLVALADEAADIVPMTAEDWAFKVVICDERGAGWATGNQERLAVQAYAQLGLQAPPALI